MGGREGRRRPSPSESSFRSVALLMLIPIAGLLLFSLLNFLRGATRRIRDSQSPVVIARPVPVAVPRRVTKQRVIPVRLRGEIVLILDDVGFDHQPLASAMSIDPNVNFAVLPNSTRGNTVANTLHARGFEVLCHLPMEPLGFPGVSPGEGAVLTSMSDAQIATATRTNVRSVPFARGVNNHMGSRATADRRVMTGVLNALPPGMYFIDSKTSADSVAGSVARSLHVKTASRNVFLDDVQNEGEIRKQLASLAAVAENRGVGVGIGHMYPSTVKVLTEEAPLLRARGFRFRRASSAVQ